jgi:hypothetical protein
MSYKPQLDERVNTGTPALLKAIPPISVAEFEFALTLIGAAAENRMQVTNPETVQFAVEEEDGYVKEYRFADRPLTRGLLALQENLEPDTAWAAALRFWLLQQSLVYPSIKSAYVERTSTHTIIHPDLVEAIATVSWRGAQPPKASAILKRINAIQTGRV